MIINVKKEYEKNNKKQYHTIYCSDSLGNNSITHYVARQYSSLLANRYIRIACELRCLYNRLYMGVLVHRKKNHDKRR